MSWVQGLDVMRLQRYVGGIWATGRSWGRSQARPGLVEVWTVSGSQIGLGNEDKSRTDLYLEKLARYVGPSSEKSGKREEDGTWLRE